MRDREIQRTGRMALLELDLAADVHVNGSVFHEGLGFFGGHGLDRHRSCRGALITDLTL
jgi:hypothetical protein